MSILVTGSIAYDTIETPFGRVKEALGGSAVYFSIAASRFTRVIPISVVGTDFRDDDRRLLEELGISLEYVKVAEGQTFRWVGRYEYDMNTAHTLDTQLNVFEKFDPGTKMDGQKYDIVFLANIDPDLQMKVLSACEGASIKACDTMDFWISSKRDSVFKVMERCDIVFMNEGELRFLTEEPNLVRAYKKLQARGVETLIVKRGEYGAICFSKEGVFFVPAFPLDTVKDPTGAGDSFAGGVLGWLDRHLDSSGAVDPVTFRQAVVMGSVVASFTVEEFSVKGLISMSDEELYRRFSLFRKMTDFEPLEKSSLRG